MEKFKTPTRRLFALAIDFLILCSFVYLESFIVVPEMPASIVIAGLIIHYVCVYFYFIYLHAIYGQTLGKMALKIRVVDVSENPINFRQAILRESPNIFFGILSLPWEIYQILTVGVTESFRNGFFDNFILAVTCLWALAEIIVMLSNEKRRSIHDFIAGTVVVRTEHQN